MPVRTCDIETEDIDAINCLTRRDISEAAQAGQPSSEAHVRWRCYLKPCHCITQREEATISQCVTITLPLNPMVSREIIRPMLLNTPSLHLKRAQIIRDVEQPQARCVIERFVPMQTHSRACFQKL